MPITLIVRDTWFYKEGFKIGLDKAKRERFNKGERKGLIEGIELGLELKYGAAGLELMDRSGQLLP
jgi:hypothetical protein